MAVTRFIDAGAGPVLIETDEENAATAAGPLFTRSLQRISEEIAKTLGQMDGDAKPSELTVSFRLKLVSGGRFLIVEGQEAGNFAIQMKFAGQGKPAFPGLPAGF